MCHEQAQELREGLGGQGIMLINKNDDVKNDAHFSDRLLLTSLRVQYSRVETDGVASRTSCKMMLSR